jgi:uncharacterized phage protein gp47/JayE
MADLPTFNDLFALGRKQVLVLNPALAIDAVDRAGSDANALVAAGAVMADEVAAHAAQLYRGMWISTAKGAQLDKLLFDRYSMVRQPASPAVGIVEFSTTAANPSVFTLPVNIRLRTPTGIQYRTITSATFPAGSTGPVQVQVASMLVGSGQRVLPNRITTISSTIAGAPSDLTVNNPVATAGDANEESDEQFSSRAQQFWQTARGGTAAAVEQRALAVPGVRSATLIELTDRIGMPDRAATLVITDEYTDELADLSAAVPAYAAQSQSLARTVLAQLVDTRPIGIPIYVYVARVRMLTITLNLTLTASATSETISVARAAVMLYTNLGRPAGVWSRAAATQTLMGIAGLQITGNEIAYPPGDVIPGPLEVLRTSASLVNTSNYAF